MKFDQSLKAKHKADAERDPLFWNRFNADLGGKQSDGSCPGHFGQGSGKNCFVCRGEI